MTPRVIRGFPEGRARSALLWGLAYFALAQLVLGVAVTHWQPVLRDPEYGYKLARLRERLAEAPGQPLLLVLGSSRTGAGLRPDVLPAWRLADGRTPIVVNAALTGSGPILELLCLRRLLADGIRPEWLAVEVLAPLLHQEGARREECWLNPARLSWSDVRVLRHYVGDPWPFYQHGLQALAAPWFAHRFGVLSRGLPDWVDWSQRQDFWRAIDAWGWMAYPAVDPAQTGRLRQIAHDTYAPSLAQFHLTDAPDRALRDLLALCRRERIRVLLFQMPEDSTFRAWYPPWARPQIAAYLAALAREYDVTLADAHAWQPDGDFVDGHHLLPAGAAAFTARFGREVLLPFVESPGPVAESRMAR